MNPVFQDEFTATNANCLQAVTASMLDLPLAGVPHFCRGRDPSSDWYERWCDWLNEQGYQLTYFTDEPHPFLHYVAFGWTRGNNFHAVVMKDGKLVHDPGRGGGLVQVTHTYYIAVL